MRRATRDASAACRAKAVRAAGKTALATEGAGEAAAAAAARACGDASPQVRAEAAKTLGALAAARAAPPEVWPAAALPLALRANDGAAAAAAVADRLAELVLEPLRRDHEVQQRHLDRDLGHVVRVPQFGADVEAEHLAVFDRRVA